MSLLPVGTPAPDFTLHATPDQHVSLAEFRGHRVVLVFYPADWSPVCGDQLAVYNEMYALFHKQDATILAISVDGVWCHNAYKEQRKLKFPLLSDFEPKGGVAKQYGAYREADGTTERALFVIDEQGVIRWHYLSPVGVNPGADGILDALDALSAGAEVAR